MHIMNTEGLTCLYFHRTTVKFNLMDKNFRRDLLLVSDDPFAFVQTVINFTQYSIRCYTGLLKRTAYRV